MKIDFDKYADKLVPAIVQDYQTKTVLMLGFMNAEAFARTRASGRVTFYSRSRQTLWTKGESSGNYLDVREILIDCDADTILIKAAPTGKVCHTGAETCFNEINQPVNFLFELEKIIKDRRDNPSNESYTSSLFTEGINKIAQKVGEETIELIIEAKDDNQDLFKNEAGDLIYHLLVLFAEKNISLHDITQTLQKRQK